MKLWNDIREKLGLSYRAKKYERSPSMMEASSPMTFGPPKWDYQIDPRIGVTFQKEIKTMADLLNVTIKAEVTRVGKTGDEAKFCTATIEYFNMDKDNLRELEAGALNGLLALVGPKQSAS